MQRMFSSCFALVEGACRYDTRSVMYHGQGNELFPKIFMPLGGHGFRGQGSDSNVGKQTMACNLWSMVCCDEVGLSI